MQYPNRSSQGLDNARGEIILSTDGDCEQPQDDPADECLFYRRSGWLGMSGISNHKIRQGIDALDYLTHRPGCGFIEEIAYTCTAANMAYRKVIFDQTGMASKLKIHQQKIPLPSLYKNSGYKIAVATDSESIIQTRGAISFFIS